VTTTQRPHEVDDKDEVSPLGDGYYLRAGRLLCDPEEPCIEASSDVEGDQEGDG